MSQDKARKKRILYVETAEDIGGSVTNVLYPMVTSLDQEQYEPLVLFYWPNPYRERFEAEGIKTLALKNARSWGHPAPIAQIQKKSKVVKDLQENKGRGSALYHALGSYLQIGYFSPQIWELARLIRANDVDLVHLNKDPAMYGRAIVLGAKLARRPIVCYAQNFSEFHAADRHIARFIDGYVHCSNAIREHCMAHGGSVAHKARTIYPGVVDVEKWSKPYDTSLIRRELGWSDEDFIAGNIGRIVPWKGQDVFLKAMAEVKRQAPDVKGLVVGGPQDSPFYEELLALTESLDLVDNVRFAGFRGDIPQVLASVDILVHSSCEPEPFATAVIEGMMAGRPVIATDAGGMPEMIRHGVTGLLANINDPGAMAEAILFYYRDQDRARQIAQAGQKRATTELTAERHVDEFEALYQTLLA
jgi:glycosyltransferase involved in cell wall biosynthesis